MRCRRFPPTPESPRRNRFTRRFQLPHERPHRKLTTAPPFRKSQRPLSLHYPNHHPILKSLVLSDFDAAALNLAQTIFDLGGVAINYMPVVSLIKEDDLIVGAVMRDSETGSEYQVKARAVINATAVFSDGVPKMDQPAAKPILPPSPIPPLY